MKSMKLASVAGVLALLLGGCGGGEGVDDPGGPTADGEKRDAGLANEYADAVPVGRTGAGGSQGGSNNTPLPPFPNGVVTLAGSSMPGMLDGAREGARFDDPVNVTVGPDGKLYVADYNNDVIRRVDAEGRVTTLTRQANFRRPFGIVFTPDGSMYAQTDWDDMGERTNESGTIWRVDRATGMAIALVRNVGRPRGMTVLPDGRLFMTDPEHDVVRIFNPGNNRVDDIAGRRDMPGFADGDGYAAQFDNPFDAVTVGERVLVADQNNHRLRWVAVDGLVTTFAGSGVPGNADGDAMTARFSRPQGLAVDRAGNVYVTDMDGYNVRRVTPDGRVTTIAGTGRGGFADSGDPMQAQFFGLEGLDVTPDGRTLFVADGNRGGQENFHRVRRITFGG